MSYTYCFALTEDDNKRVFEKYLNTKQNLLEEIKYLRYFYNLIFKFDPKIKRPWDRVTWAKLPSGLYIKSPVQTLQSIFGGMLVGSKITQQEIFTSSDTWNNSGFNFVKVYGIGGGASGGGASLGTRGGGGGGGGGSAIFNSFDVSSGNQSVVIGIGGAAVPANTNGNNGGDTTLGGTLIANRGNQGIRGTLGGTGGNGGAVNSSADISYRGGNGVTGFSSSEFLGGGGGGAAGWTEAGGDAVNQNGGTGNSPGGNGGTSFTSGDGGATSGTLYGGAGGGGGKQGSGGAGQPGYLILEFFI